MNFEHRTSKEGISSTLFKRQSAATPLFVIGSARGESFDARFYSFFFDLTGRAFVPRLG
jgi:hypothetical protein